MISIRLIEYNDLETLKSLENECFVSPWKESDLLYEMKVNPINTIYVAIDENKVVGFIDYMTTFNSATISQIAVTKSYRKQGVATMLLKKMFESFPTSGDEVVEFTTLEVRASNVAAQKLYIKNGFEVITTKKNYYSNGEDAIYMVKRMN